MQSLNYQSQEDCVWRTQAPVHLEYEQLVTESSNSLGTCVYDYLQVPYISGSSSDTSNRYCTRCASCSETTPPALLEKGNDIRWKTDVSNEAEGFRVCVTEAVASDAPSPYPTWSPTLEPRLPSAFPTSEPSSVPTNVPSSQPTGAHCGNGVMDGDETDIDCGGTSCPGCAESRGCSTFSDCLSLNCNSLNKCYAAPTSAPSAPPTNLPSNQPSQQPSSAPFDKFTACKDSPCWTGREECCSVLQSNLYATSRLTNRVVVYDSSNLSFQTFLEKNEVGSHHGVETDFDVVMSVDFRSYIDFSADGSQLLITQQVSEPLSDTAFVVSNGFFSRTTKLTNFCELIANYFNFSRRDFCRPLRRTPTAASNSLTR